MSTASSSAKRFKGSDMEKELESLYKNGLIDQTTTAKEAYELSLVFKRDVTFDKFQPKYYNWKRKKTFTEEADRNGGYGPPEDVLAGNSNNIVANGVVPTTVEVPPAPGVARGLFVSPVAAVRPSTVVTASRNVDRKNNADCMVIPFQPATLATVLRNQQGQRIVEVCIWLQSGCTLDDISVFVSDDMKSLKYQVPMDFLMENGWGLHTDVVIGGDKMSREERAMHVRVHHWNAFIDEMRTSDGLLPVYTAEIPLPVDVCSKKILRKTGKASRWGSKMLVLDLLVEDSKLPATTKLGFDMVDDEEFNGFDSDDCTLNSNHQRTRKN